MRHAEMLWTLVPSLATALALPLAAQTPLTGAVERYLAEVSDETAKTRLEALLARDDALPEALWQAVTTRPATLHGTHRILVPHAGDLLAVEIEAPEQREDGTLLPVLFAINSSSPPIVDAVRGRVVQASVPGYTPEQFSDAGRDAHMKLLRAVAFAAGGDPDALWFTGFSWGGHACWDAALHRPGVVRGFISRGGGPRRTWYRLLPNLADGRALAICGGMDDPELVWNLREVARLAPGLKLDYEYREAAENGHDQPLPGEREAGLALLASGPRPHAAPANGIVLADAAFVEHPLLRIDAVDEAKCAVPDRIGVPGNLSPDAMRRAVIARMSKALVSVGWRIARKSGVATITVTGAGVPRATLFFRAPWFTPGERVVVRARNATLFDGLLEIEPRTLLEEARRTGDRLRPALARIELRL